MKKINFDCDWKFSYSTGTAYLDQKGQSYKKMVNLPHDFMISTSRTADSRSEGACGFFQGGTGTYEKEFNLTSNQKNHHFILVIEGSYGFTEVWINGNLASQHPYGYTEFHVDLTEYLTFEKPNKLKIVVNNNAMPNSRWYSGSGLYRHVNLLEGEEIYLNPWAVAIQTPDLEHVNMNIDITNCNVETVKELTVEILSPDGECVTKTSEEIKLNQGLNNYSFSFSVLDGKVWDLDQRNLYTAKIIIGNELHFERFGIRTISVDRENGFCLNGVPVKLKGGCVHHDNGIVGACAYDEFEVRKIRLLKESGYNAIRCSHNPMSKALLDACDDLGMLVVDESFDCWNIKKHAYDYHLFFADWWKKDLESMILRDRNHPSVIIYSVGNEIGERDGSSRAEEISKEICEYAVKLDPTRPTTNGVCMVFLDAGEFGGILANIFGSGNPVDFSTLPEEVKGFIAESDDVKKRWGEITESFIKPLDIAGYNYLDQRYDEDGEKFPERIILGTESYPKSMNSVWEKTMKHSYVIGDFTWTAWDYLGESGIGHALYGEHGGLFMDYPWHIANCGDYDICGFLRPQGQARKLLWKVNNSPVISVLKPEHDANKETISSWGWEDVIESYSFPGFEGKEIRVSIYSNAEEVELLLNDKVIEKKEVPENGIVHMNVIYEPGELKAINYRQGKIAEESKLSTVGVPHHIAVIPENSIKNSATEIQIFRIEMQDMNNNRVPYAENMINVDAGKGIILGLGNSKPDNEEPYTDSRCSLWEGRALLAVKTPDLIKVSL